MESPPIKIKEKLNKIYHHFIYTITECVRLKNIDILPDYIETFNKKHGKSYKITMKDLGHMFILQLDMTTSNHIDENRHPFKLIHSLYFIIDKKDSDDFYEFIGMNSLIKVLDKGKTVLKEEINIDSKPFRERIPI